MIRIGVDARIGPERDAGRETIAARAGVACVLGLVGGVVVAQWGSASLPAVVHAQANGSVFGVAGWGLPTAWVQPGAFVVATIGVVLVGVAPHRSAEAGGPRGALLRVVDALWVVAAVAWLVTCFAGGGSVPWTVQVDGVRHVISSLALLVKVGLGCVAVVWARETWPSVTTRLVRTYLGVGAAVAVISIGATVLLRHLL